MAHRKLVFSKSFEKSYLKFVRGNRALKSGIQDALLQLEKDAFSPSLRTHKLSGNLYGLLACSCGYDCRIVFSMQKTKSSEEIILLVDIGTHNEVY
ncbi:MAG TPA: type II toxin-antitoxin system mRNA interferase toxin, RelE/StbE family [Bacteroidia bacterium]|nr:type II toxin-antitoxin system mRNA interferase toxin, RelE/StbE family [Bacteroidia bacterium]